MIDPWLAMLRISRGKKDFQTLQFLRAELEDLRVRGEMTILWIGDKLRIGKLFDQAKQSLTVLERRFTGVRLLGQPILDDENVEGGTDEIAIQVLGEASKTASSLFDAVSSGPKTRKFPGFARRISRR